jgi:Putative peptidoglycan binding domain/Resolvase, N terminal domain
MRRRYVSGLAAITGLVLGVGILTMGATSAGAVVEPGSRTLAQGAGMGATPDPEVRSLQQILRAEGRSLGPAGVDGRFGPATAAAVRSFQQSFGLPADGVVGPKTRKLMRVVCRSGKCGSAADKVANRSAASKNEEPVSAGGSGPLHDVAPTATVVLAILFALVAYRRWRMNREARAYAAPAHPFPAVRPERRPARRAIGYLGALGDGLTAAEDEAQEEAIERECRQRGWMLIDVLREVRGGGREALAHALDMIDEGGASCLVVANLDSVAGSAAGLGRFLSRMKDAGAGFVALDAEIDTTTREGALAAALLAGVTRRERERTRSNGGGNGHRYTPPRGVPMN